jgi:PAS domain S-box-containing protein
MSNSELKKDKEKLENEILQLRKEIDQLKKQENPSKLKFRDSTIKENLFHSVFQEAGIGIALIDKNNKIINSNSTFSSLFDYEKNELEKMTYFDVIPDNKKENAKMFIDAIFSSKKMKYETEQPYLKKDGSLFWLKLTTTVINDENGNPEYILGMGEDITERVESGKKLKEAKEKAEESDKLKTAFLTNMSHEIRTPMNAIIGFSELIADPNIDTESRKEFSEQIYLSSKSLMKLIDDIIDISQIDSGILKISKQEFDLSEFLFTSYEAFNKEKKKENKSNIELLLHNPFGDCTVLIETDRYRLQQIIDHLLSNALKYSHNGFIELGFDTDKDDTPIFYVRDTGIGIPEDKTEQIFKHFTKIEDNTKLYRGTGIGLTITKKLVSLLGGTIRVESNPGIGSIFYFTLSDKVKIPYSNKSLTTISKNYNWEGIKILVAEDEDTNFHVIKATLSRTNANIVRVFSGDQAVEACKQNGFDIVLMDIKMPILDGIEATKLIKEFKPNLPIIAQTAYVLKNERTTCIDAGCNDYMSKPVTAQKLLEAIQRLLP